MFELYTLLPRPGNGIYQAKGYALDLADCLIAASTLAEGAMLATKNAKHYPFDGLQVIVPEYA